MKNKEKNIRCKRKICLQAIFGKKTKDENKTKIHDSKCASLYNRN